MKNHATRFYAYLPLNTQIHLVCRHVRFDNHKQTLFLALLILTDLTNIIFLSQSTAHRTFETDESYFTSVSNSTPGTLHSRIFSTFVNVLLQ